VSSPRGRRKKSVVHRSRPERKNKKTDELSESGRKKETAAEEKGFQMLLERNIEDPLQEEASGSLNRRSDSHGNPMTPRRRGTFVPEEEEKFFTSGFARREILYSLARNNHGKIWTLFVEGESGEA